MSRSQRLLDLLQLLRCHKYPVPAKELAGELGVSVRTVYRDVITLQAQGADITGEAGLGYVLKPGFTLPPLMLGVDELEALRLGAEWVAQNTDPDLAQSALHALAKISSVLPTALKSRLGVEVMRMAGGSGGGPLFGDLRRVVSREKKLRIRYLDLQENTSTRVVWPLLIGCFEHCYVLVAWCETREAFRHFRLDRIIVAEPCDESYGERRRVLLKKWREEQGVQESRIRY